MNRVIAFGLKPPHPSINSTFDIRFRDEINGVRQSSYLIWQGIAEVGNVPVRGLKTIVGRFLGHHEKSL